MNNQLKQTIVSGIAGTAVMTIFMLWLGPVAGLPEMNTAAMLSMIMGMPVAMGWFIHFVIGITLAAMYVLFFSKVARKISSPVVKGLVFGAVAFIIGQVGLGIMGALFGGMPPMDGSMMLMMIGSIIGHLVFGVVVVLIAKDQSV